MLRLDEIKQAALAVGFDDCGVARADALTDEEYPLREWLRRGWHGDLDYMERNADKRMDPRLLVPGAKSVICCVSAYPPPDDILPASGGNPGNPGNRFDKISQDLNDPNESWKSNNNLHDFQDFAKREKVAAYAKYRDYHKDIKQMLFALRERLGIEGKCCCDTVPISDKHWAARAGLGWIGRHTLLVTPRWGSWVNLGEIVTTEEIKHNSSLIIHHSVPPVAAASTPVPTTPSPPTALPCSTSPAAPPTTPPTTSASYPPTSTPTATPWAATSANSPVPSTKLSLEPIKTLRFPCKLCLILKPICRTLERYLAVGAVEIVETKKRQTGTA